MLRCHDRELARLDSASSSLVMRSSGRAAPEAALSRFGGIATRSHWRLVVRETGGFVLERWAPVFRKMSPKWRLGVSDAFQERASRCGCRTRGESYESD